METLTAATIATMLLTKMIEKVGEMAGEKLPELGATPFPPEDYRIRL